MPSKANISPAFSEVIKINAQAADNIYKSIINKEQLRKNIAKSEWSGDIFDIDKMGKPFDRTANYEDLINAIKDGENPGVVGDLIASTLQGEWLAAQERAFRLRHSSRIRLGLHAAARRRGHGHKAGLFLKGIVNYIKNIVKLSKDV